MRPFPAHGPSAIILLRVPYLWAACYPSLYMCARACVWVHGNAGGSCLCLWSNWTKCSQPFYYSCVSSTYNDAVYYNYITRVDHLPTHGSIYHKSCGIYENAFTTSQICSTELWCRHNYIVHKQPIKLRNCLIKIQLETVTPYMTSPCLTFGQSGAYSTSCCSPCSSRMLIKENTSHGGAAKLYQGARTRPATVHLGRLCIGR